jgi:hypothetical protein
MGAGMEVTSLNGGWQADLGSGFVDAAVPGCWEQPGGSKRFTGPVVYRRAFDCPPRRAGERTWVQFDAVSYACELSVNGRPAGTHEGMWDSFRFDVTDLVRPGARNEIRLAVVKPGYSAQDRFPLRDVLSGFIPDVLCTFGGIWGDVELQQGPAARPGHVMVRCRGVEAELALEVIDDAALPSEVSVRLSRNGRELYASRQETTGSGIVRCRFSRDGIEPWRLEDPVLHDLDVVVRSRAGEARVSRRIGLREIAADRERILLNGEPVYIRGALHWGCYPDRIVPRPTPVEIRDELIALRRLGFNAVKHCLWVPRDEYYAACDELGILAWLELPLWLPRMTPALEARMAAEYPRIVRQCADHASIVIYSLGCELGADVAGPLLERLARDVREMSGGALVRDNSGSGECYGGLAEDYSDFYDYHFYADPHLLEPLMETFTPRWRPVRPWLFGEYADADTWRELPAGGSAPWWAVNDPDANPVSALKPDFRLHLQAERLKAPGIRPAAGVPRPPGALAAAAREHALLHRKLSLEATRAFPEAGGYNVTAIRDVPIATSGIFDDEGLAKFEPAELLPFNADLVLVPRWDLARVWVRGDRVLEADRFNTLSRADWSLRIVASNFGPRVSAGDWSWSLSDAGGTRFASGSGSLAQPLERGETRELLRMAARSPRVSVPTRLTASASLRHGAAGVQNEWPIFVWPDTGTPAEPGHAPDHGDATPRGEGIPAGGLALDDPLGILEPLRQIYGAFDFGARGSGPRRSRPRVVAATQLDERLRRWVRAGGRALLVQRGRGAFPHDSVGFWREGFAVFEEHPLASVIPPGRFRELALYGMATDTALSWITPGADLRSVKPIITRVDAREFTAQHYLVEIGLGRGRMIVTTLRVEGGMGRQPSGLANSAAARFLVDRCLRHLLRG